MKTKCSGTLAIMTMSSLVLATTLTGCTAVPDQQVSTVTPPVQPGTKAKGKDKKKTKEEEEKEKQQPTASMSNSYHGFGGGRTWWWNWGGNASTPSSSSSTKYGGTQVSAKSTAFSGGGRPVGSVSRGGFGWGGFFAGG